MLSIISLFLIDQLRAQTGQGCFFTDCPNPNKVRIDAIVGANGDFLGGCYCDCPPSLECAAGTILKRADCLCIPDTTPSNPSPVTPSNPSPANPAPARPSGPSIDTIAVGRQQGLGCPVATCPDPVQVRVDAILNVHGEFVGGCYCECPYSLFDETSLDYCAPPNVVTTDCICGPPPPPTAAPPPTAPAPPVPAPAAPAAPAIPGQGTPANPANPGNRPAVTIPTEVICEAAGPCGCPIGTQGECYILCEGTIGCKDGIIDCNNDGYPCTVECVAEQGCLGTTFINGPAGAPLTVECTGEKACEGALTINGQRSTDLTVVCDGLTSCKGGVFNFGTGAHTVGCNGEPGATSTCDLLEFNLIRGAATIPGMAFSCTGLTCPVNTPPAFNNVLGPKGSTCKDAGDCGCLPGTKDICTINCKGGPDACKDGIIGCNNDGFDCIVNCHAMNGCAGSAMIVGPVGGRLTVNCIGEKACEGGVVFDGELTMDMTVICEGPEACKGDAVFNYGRGVSILECNGRPDTCSGAPEFNMLPGTEGHFKCFGNACPANIPGAAAPV